MIKLDRFIFIFFALCLPCLHNSFFWPVFSPDFFRVVFFRPISFFFNRTDSFYFFRPFLHKIGFLFLLDFFPGFFTRFRLFRIGPILFFYYFFRPSFHGIGLFFSPVFFSPSFFARPIFFRWFFYGRRKHLFFK